MKYLKYLTLIACLSFFLVPVALHAASATGLNAATQYLSNVGEAAYGVKQAPDLPSLVGKIINIFLSILGVLFVVLMVYGGYTWMTSYGDTAKVKKARDLIVDAVIGLIIVLTAYAISNFVVSGLIKATTGSTT